MRPVFRDLAPGLHILSLHAVAVAAPLYDVLRRNREFFVAYRATTVDLLLLAAVVSLAVPLAAVAIAELAGLRSRRVKQGVVVAVIGLLGAALGSQGLARFALSSTTHLAASAAVGAAAAALYGRHAVARTFLTFLSPAIVIIPAALLLHPSMRPFLAPADPAERVAGEVSADTPIVLVVFDQLPLTSIVTPEGRIDAAHYPGFAALASQSTWYRRATTVADLTGWALPAIVTGRYPRPSRLPIAEDYPSSLFTFLARSHRMEVVEPITALCPPSVCAGGREALFTKMGGMLLDSGVVYAYVLAPPSLASMLPPLTQNWRGFIAAQRWQQRWINERDADRRRAPNAFLEGIQRTDPQPTVYFLHALLPHEPYQYLPSGQQFTASTNMIGLLPNGRWVEDLWPVSQAYGAELIQVGYVDRFVTRLVARLRAEGLYERALLIVTADHGASFRPGLTFKGINETTLRDIAPVPLFVKLPFQREGSVSDRNVQNIDIMPVVADVLETTLTWEAAGVSPLRADTPAPPVKTIYYAGAARRIRITPDDLDARGEAVRRRVELLGGEEVEFRTPRIAPHRELVGRSTETIAEREETALRIIVDQARQWADVDPNGELIPSVITGRVLDELRRPASATLAVGVNGRIEATTKTYDRVPGFAGVWSAMVDPRVFRKGANTVEVFVVRADGARTVLTRGYSTDVRTLAAVNLVSEEAQASWQAKLSGLHPLEGPSNHQFRWTSGPATLVWPLPGEERPRSLRIGLAPVARPTPLRVTYNGCIVLDAEVPGGGSYRTVSLDRCPPAAREAGEARIQIESRTFTAPTDPRTLGIPIETLRVSSEPWPLGPAPSATRGKVVLVGPPVAVEGQEQPSGTAILLEVTNLGDRSWASAAEAATDRPVRLAAMWRSEPGADPVEGHTVDLPRVLYPADRAQAWVRLDPPPAVAQSRRSRGYVSFELFEGNRAVELVEPGAPGVPVVLR